MAALRIIFMGTPELACASLRALLASPAFAVVAVVTQPDKPRGRDLKLQPSSVKALALAANIPVLQPEKARSPEFLDQLRQLAPDLIAVAAYGQILPQALLDLPRFGCLNVHTSLLPKYRGASPIQSAILNGDAETGVTIMKIVMALDSGGIVAQARTPVLPEDTAATLHDRLAQMGGELLARVIPDYVEGKAPARPQPPEGATYAHKIAKENGRMDWSLPALTLWNRVRGLIPWPGAFTFLPNQPHPHLLKIWEAEIAEASGAPGEILSADKSGIVVGCGERALRLLELQREGGKRLTARQFLAGHPLKPGCKLG